MPGRSDRTPGAFLTISELARELGLPQHRLRYWETRFPQLRPMQRAGQRRYYRPADVELVRRIHRLLGQEGYTIAGVQRLLASERGSGAVAGSDKAGADPLRRIRTLIADALAADQD